ncbi:MAG: tRNA pseudouridine(55) synthase TruB [Candidatus Marinimicrobia bacterium]|nr:tRNA pseudouridine(55) synthase TruB [Candidatus Neomarinimicrobiota bacterium]MBL7046399.1 tRNA pseudouridine(55) synthase TruB [Candidatus Neomarinimicrobiota bacterium]
MIIPVYKPEGWTSFDVVKKVRAISGEKKVGHSGTLDPFAEGVLVLGLGSSTKELTTISQQDKTYEAVLKLGIETDSLDVEGRVISKSPIPVLSREKIQYVFERFTGVISQVPPMYSAKKVNGTRLYKYARKNIKVDRNPVIIEVKSLKLKDFSDDKISFSVDCSKGTYIRQLGSDIAVALGTVGHLIHLVRTRIGTIRLADCRRIEDLEKEWIFTEV